MGRLRETLLALAAVQPTTSRLVHAVRQTLNHRLAPQLKEPNTLALVATIDVALSELLRRLDGKPMRLHQSVQVWNELIAKGASLLGAAGKSIAALESKPDDSFERLNELNDEARSRAVALIEALQRNCWDSGEIDRQSGQDLIRAILMQELGDLTAETDSAAEEPINLRGPLSVDPEHLTQEIAAKLAVKSPIEIQNVTLLAGGFSRITLLVDWIAAKQTRSLIIRKQKPAPIMENVALGVAGEFPVLQFAYSHGIAVPQPLWLQTDPAVLGADFMAMQRVPGQTLGSAMGATGVTDDIMRQIAFLLAKLHQTPWEANETELARAFRLTPGKIDVRTTLDALLERWENRWKSANLRPSPLYAAALGWLKRHRPERDVRPCLLHGDIGFHNILFQDGQLTALLDWETSFLGDPAKDIATCQSFVGLYTDWEKFLDWYREAGGPPIDSAAVRYYSVMRVYTQLLVGAIGLETKFADDATSEIEYLYLGGPVRRYFLNDFLSCLDAVVS